MKTEIHNKLKWTSELQYYNEELDEFYDITGIHYCEQMNEYNIHVNGNHKGSYNDYNYALKELIQEICIEYSEDWEIFEL